MAGAIARVMSALDRCEREGRCLVPGSHADAVALRRLVRSGRCIEPVTGIFARSEAWKGLNPERRARFVVRGLALRHPAWVFCGPTAALVHGLDVPCPLLGLIHVHMPGRRGTRLAPPRDGRIRFHEYRGIEPVEVGGVAVAPLWRAVADCLLTAPFPLALAVADSAARMRGVNREGFARHIEQEIWRRHGAGRARAISSHVDPLAENGGESRVRAFLIEHGYPMPDLQVEVPNPLDPRHPYRVDFYWLLPDGTVIVGEFDGLGKYRDAACGAIRLGEAVRERQRESRITLLGYPVLRFTFDDLAHPEKLHAILHGAGLRPDPHRAHRID